MSSSKLCIHTTATGVLLTKYRVISLEGVYRSSNESVSYGEREMSECEGSLSAED